MEGLGALAYEIAEVVEAIGHDQVEVAADGRVVEAVDRYPGLAGELISATTGVLAGAHERRDDRGGIEAADGEEIDDPRLGDFGIELVVAARETKGGDERLPGVRSAGQFERPGFEAAVEGHVQEARRVFRAFDVAAHPEQRFGDAAKEGH